MHIFTEAGVDDPRHARSIVISRKVFPEKFPGHFKVRLIYFVSLLITLF